MKKKQLLFYHLRKIVKKIKIHNIMQYREEENRVNFNIRRMYEKEELKIQVHVHIINIMHAITT